MSGYKCALVSLFLILATLACGKTPQVTPVNAAGGVAIKGYDPVVYFTEQRPVKGTEEYEYLWEGAKWRFLSAEHLDLFKSDPEKYAPKYGGYCAYAVSQGKTADIDPEAWTVFEGRLYLNLNKDVQRLWEKDMVEYIRKADENWHRMFGKNRGV